MPPRSERLHPLDVSADSYPDHPLFPVDEGEKNPQVTFIQITRLDRGVQKYGPVIRADELMTLDALFEMYGGGMYELWARGPSKMKEGEPGNISKRRRFNLPGRSKPLSKDPTPDELRELEGFRPGATESAPAPSSNGGGGENNFLLAMMNMQQQNAQQFAAMMQAMMQSSKQESMEMAKMQMASQQQNTTLMLTLSQQNQASMVQMMTAMMGSRGSGPDEMAKYAKLLKDLNILGGGSAGSEAEGGDGEGGIGKMIEDAADAIQGLVLLKGGAKPGDGQGGASGAPAEAAPAGSAAAVADAILPKI